MIEQHFSHARSVWQLSTYTGAGEAVICSVRTNPERGKPSGKPVDHDRAEQEACRRAATKVRRLAVANELSRLWTLTFAVEPADERAVVKEMAAFMKKCAATFRNWKYIYVIERGEKNGRLHVHFATNRFVPKSAVQKLWGNGFVDARHLGRGGGGGARNAAKYLAKYCTKAGGNAQRPKHSRRFVPSHRLVLHRSTSFHLDYYDAERQAVADMHGRKPSYVWSSSEAKDWRGPPCTVAFW